MRILICDSQEIVRLGIKHLLQQLPIVDHVEEASAGNGVLTILQNSDFDLIILGVSFPGIGALEVLASIKKKWKSAKVLILSIHTKEQYVKRAIKLGASGYLAKDTASEELLIAVKKIIGGGKYISHSLAEKLAFFKDDEVEVPKHDRLSKREYATMIKLANGMSLGEIGNELLISIKTVSTYRSRIMGKMKLNKNTELTKYCLANELI